MTEQFNLLLQEIKSMLKDNGFKANGKTFNKTFSVGSIQVVNIQLGQMSLAGSFTINLGICTGHALADSKSVSLLKCQHRQRIGFVMGQGDVWWNQSMLTETERAEILQALGKGLQWLDEHSATS